MEGLEKKKVPFIFGFNAVRVSRYNLLERREPMEGWFL